MLRQVFHATSKARVFRRLLSDRKFPSILQDAHVASPFADPTRTRVDTSTPIILAQKELHVQKGGSIEHELKEANANSSTSTTPSEKEILPQNKVVEDKRADHTEKLSALEELTALKESVEKLKQQQDKQGQDGGSSGGAGEEFHDEEAEKRRQRMARNTKIGMVVVFGSALSGFIAFCMYYGRADRDESGHAVADEFSSAGILAPFYRIANSIKAWRDYVVEPAREKLLPDPLQPPYVQPKYTLVIEMKNVLVAPEWTYKTGYRFVKRPALDYFLDIVGYPNFEVVIYTSESNFTGPQVVESIDPKQRIMWKLFRDCTKYKNGVHIKDLSKLNRDLSKVIFIEWEPSAFQLNPENVLRVPKWEGDMNDTSLVDLAELLKTIHLSDVEDVRPTLQYYSQYDNPATEFRKRAQYLAQQEEDRKRGEGKDVGLLKRYSGRLFGFRRHEYAK